MIFSTGDLKQNYSIIDIIFTYGSTKEGFFGGTNTNKAFEDVKAELSKKCEAIGGDAVINCRFEHRVAVDGRKQVFELFAYGTAVKIQ